MKDRWWSWALMALVLVGALSYGAARDPGPQTAQDRVTAIARVVRCPGCAGETVAESNAASSREIRADIARRVSAGEGDDEILAHYASTYGEAILLTPASSGVSALVWVIPVVVVAVGILGLVLVFRRGRDRVEVEPTEEDRARVAAALHDLEQREGRE